MCTLSLIPKKKKNTFNGSLPPFHGEGRRGEWNESNLIGWSRRHRANCKRFLQAGRGRKNKASAIERPVIFKWTVATHPRVWNSVWLSRNIYLSSHCFHPSSLSQRNQSLALSLDESSNCFSPLPPHFSFSFLFLFFSHFSFFFFFLSPFHIPSQYLPWRFAARFASAKSWNNSDYRLMRGSNHFDFESIPDLF